MTNPYSPPEAEFSEPLIATAESKVHALNGRIGRLRYLAYSFGLILVSMIAVGIVSGILGVIWPPLAFVSVFLGYALIAVVTVIVARRRLQDLDKSGWFAVLALIPVLNILFGLWLMFAPGDSGANSYGAPPEPNTAGVIALAFVTPVIAIIGILAAVAIPAYSDYTQRARVSSGQQF